MKLASSGAARIWRSPKRCQQPRELPLKLRSAQLAQINHQDRDRRRRHARDPVGLAQCQRRELREFLLDLPGQSADLRIIHIFRKADVFDVLEFFDALELLLDKPFVFDLVFDLVNNVLWKIFKFPVVRRNERISFRERVLCPFFIY